MRYDLTAASGASSSLFCPRTVEAASRATIRRILNGISWVLRTGASWRDLSERYGPYTTANNRFNRWRKAGIWDRPMDSVVKAHDGKAHMVDSSIVRVHQHASGVKKERRSLSGPKVSRLHHEARGSMRKAA